MSGILIVTAVIEGIFWFYILALVDFAAGWFWHSLVDPQEEEEELILEDEDFDEPYYWLFCDTRGSPGNWFAITEEKFATGTCAVSMTISNPPVGLQSNQINISMPIEEDSVTMHNRGLGRILL